ncbi:MAG: iron-sulfur cluster assembly accessory protein [Acidobacteriota bacterium]|nr:iron-sulfur cluster assembly accessory protein [Acidobacteriota bacterium]
MINFTPIAVSKVKEIIAERDASLGLRIAAVAGGCSGFQYQMTLDKQQAEDDESLDFDGLKVLVDTQSMIFLDGTTIDFVEARDGSGFTFDNPNAQSGCSSCGGGCSTETE